MSVRFNVPISKIMRTPLKVGVRTYATYANWRTLVSTKYGLHFEWNLFFRKICNLEIFNLEIVQNCPSWGFWPFSRFCTISFLDFGHNDWCAWYLVVFLQFTGPVNVFLLFFNMANLLQIKLWEVLEKIGRKNVIKKHP